MLFLRHSAPDRLPLDHVFVDELGHDGDGHSCRGGGQDVLDLSVLHINRVLAYIRQLTHSSLWRSLRQQLQVKTHLEADNILAVDLTDVVVGQKAIASGRTILDQRSDVARLEDEPNVA